MHTATPLPAGRSNKLPGFCLKHIISWEIKTLLKAGCNKAIKGCAVSSSWCQPCQHQEAQGAVHSACGTAPTQSQGNYCWDFALKISPRAGGAQPHGERAAHYVLCNQHSPAPLHHGHYYSFFTNYWSENSRFDSQFELLLLEPENNAALAGCN